MLRCNKCGKLILQNEYSWGFAFDKNICNECYHKILGKMAYDGDYSPKYPLIDVIEDCDMAAEGEISYKYNECNKYKNLFNFFGIRAIGLGYDPANNNRCCGRAVYKCYGDENLHNKILEARSYNPITIKISFKNNEFVTHEYKDVKICSVGLKSEKTNSGVKTTFEVHIEFKDSFLIN